MRDTRGRRGEVSRPHQSRGLQVMQLCVKLLQLGPHVGQPLLQARRQRRPVPEARRCQLVKEIRVDSYLHTLRGQEGFRSID